MTEQYTTKQAQPQAPQGQISTTATTATAIARAIAPLPTPPDVPDVISYEHTLAVRSAEVAMLAIRGLITGSYESKISNSVLSGARVLQGAARLSQDLRLTAEKMAMQESKVITHQPTAQPEQSVTH